MSEGVDVSVTEGSGGLEGSMSDPEAIGEASNEGMEEALAAAKEALDAGKSEMDELFPDAPGAEKKAEAKADESDPLTEIEKTLEKRRADAKEKLRIREEIAHERRQLEAERQKFVAERRELDEAVGYLKKLRTDPAAAVEAMGWDPEQFIADLANAGTPEHKHRSEMESTRAELSALKQQLEAIKSGESEARKQHAQRQQQQLIQTAEQQFLNEALSDDFPVFKNLFSGPRQAFLLQEAHAVAEEYYQATGKAASYRDIADYLHQQYSSSVGSQVQTQQGKPPQGKRGATTLGSIQSERSPGYEPNEDDSDEDALRKAIAATRAELKSFSG